MPWPQLSSGFMIWEQPLAAPYAPLRVEHVNELQDQLHVIIAPSDNILMGGRLDQGSPHWTSWRFKENYWNNNYEGVLYSADAIIIFPLRYWVLQNSTRVVVTVAGESGATGGSIDFMITDMNNILPPTILNLHPLIANPFSTGLFNAEYVLSTTPFPFVFTNQFNYYIRVQGGSDVEPGKENRILKVETAVSL